MSDVVNAELLRENIAHALSGLDADTWAYALGEYRRMLGEPFPRPQVADRSSVADAFRQADKVVAILPGLQAEAPEDARKDEIEIAKHISGLIFPKANDADFKGFVERHGVHIAAIIRADRNAAPAQAEAQAPANRSDVLSLLACCKVLLAHDVVPRDTDDHICQKRVSDTCKEIHRLIRVITEAEAQAPTTAASVLTEDERRKINEDFERAMAPRANPKHPMFRDHNCWKCGDGEHPCAKGNYATCPNPHARND